MVFPRQKIWSPQGTIFPNEKSCIGSCLNWTNGLLDWRYNHKKQQQRIVLWSIEIRSAAKLALKEEKNDAICNIM